VPAVPTRATTLTGWGAGPGVPVTVFSPDNAEQLRAVALEWPGVIPRGAGRSYGDAAQLTHGRVLDMRSLRSFELDSSTGVMTAQAGATLGELLAALQPEGWMLPVVPGTQHVTVGGAIASDIHGKNHSRAGTFGEHVLAIGILTADGEVRELQQDAGDELLAATIGGMGLTGVILWARIKLSPLPSPLLSVDTNRVNSFEEALEILDGPGGPHRVAWLDLLGGPLVRGIVTRAEQLPDPPAAARRVASMTVAARTSVPALRGAGLLRPSAVRAFNELRFRRAPRQATGRLESFGSHMFPLDALGAWPRLYGRAGFVQYQLVLPRGREEELGRLIAGLRRSSVPCYLAVLKDLGRENGSPLSFPLSGWTLTLDLPRSAPGLEPLLQSFDEAVVEAGGRVYLAKDWRLQPSVLAAMYPRLDRWREVRDRVDPERRWQSDLGLRCGLVSQ
jgi:decaprenylphospho-beta-D-ribofuranose 2-oxidase